MNVLSSSTEGDKRRALAKLVKAMNTAQVQAFARRYPECADTYAAVKLARSILR